MDAMEIMTNDEVKEVTTEIVTGGSNTAIKVIAGVGAAGIVGFAIYKAVKHISAKRKAKKEQFEAAKVVNSDFNENDLDDEDVEDEE